MIDGEMARTTTTTREQTWNRHRNYPLKMFLCWLGRDDVVARLKAIQTRETVTDPSKLTDEPDLHAQIGEFLAKNNPWDVDLT